MLGSNISGTDAWHNQNTLKSEGKEANAGNVRVFSVDKVTVEKIVLESSNGSREVLLTKNETSRKLSLSSETKPNVVKRTKDERQTSSTSKFRVSVPEDAFTSKPNDAKTIALGSQSSKLPISTSRKSDNFAQHEDNRIKPIKFIKSPSIGSIVIEGLNLSNAIAKKNKVPPKVPEKPAVRKERNSSLISTPVTKVESCEDSLAKQEKVVEKTEVRIKEEESVAHETPGAEDAEKEVDRKDNDGTSSAGIEKHNEASERANVDGSETKENKENDASKGVESHGECAKIDAQDRLEKSQSTIEDLQKNLTTKIHASTAQSYKEKLLDLQANYALRSPVAADSNCERLSCGFDKDFLEKHNLDKRLKIEEKRLLETDLDYTSDNDRISETEDHRSSNKIGNKRKYSEKVTEVEKRWSGEFLVHRLQRNSSGSSKSSYVEEFGSVSSRESIVEDRDARLLFDRRHPEKFAERQTSIDEPRRRTSDEILENSTVSTVDSDSCLEDRIKAVDEDIAQVTNGAQTDENDDVDEVDQAYEENKDRWNEEVEANDSSLTTTIVDEKEDRNLKGESSDHAIDVNGYSNPNSNEETNSREKNNGEETLAENVLNEGSYKTFNPFTEINSKESADPTFVLRGQRRKDGYANLIKEFTMEAGSSKVKKEEKQKKKLGFRRLLPSIFSPKDSRKDYKKKEQKERKRYDERHFVRYQQNGNYTRSPDTMNLNEDIKRNVKLDSSLNGSMIEERLDEIKRELFPEQGPITSTPDHFLQTNDARHLRARRDPRGQRSYTADSSLSSIAPDERWLDRSGQLGISPDIRKYEQRQRREEQDSRRYGHLERKHSLQESNHGNRGYFFQRNHAASGRISAPPSERYLMRPRAVHPVDRPLPEIPQSRIELSNYENYQDGVDRLCDGLDMLDVTDSNVDYQNQSALYQNDRNFGTSLIHAPQSVPAQVKITRQPIVNQTQRAPLIRTPKYASSGSSQKSGDYADSSCTPNSSQKSEFSRSSSKSGEYYLNSPRSSARASPAERPSLEDARERVYENGAQRGTSQLSDNYIEEHVYDETPSETCYEIQFPNKKQDHSTENSPEKKDDFIYEQKCLSSTQQSLSKNSFPQLCEDIKSAQTESKQETERSRDECLRNNENIDTSSRNDSLVSAQTDRTSARNVSPTKYVLTATSPLPGPRARRSQPNDQILIASPKREAICQSRVSRPSNEIRLCDAESPVFIADSREGISGIVPVEARENQYGGQNSPAAGIGRQRAVSSSGFSKGISRPEPIYGHRRQASPSQQSNAVASEMKENKLENDQQSPSVSHETCRNTDERTTRVQSQISTSRGPQSLDAEIKQALNLESGRRAAQSPISELSNVTQEVCQQRTWFATPTSSSESQQSLPMTNQDKMYTSTSSLQREPIYEQRQRQRQSPQQQCQEPSCVQRTADPTQQGQSFVPLSPTKRETRQHLEAFYWQQKALEAQRKSVVPTATIGLKKLASKIDLPEMREAMYWQQLKRLDEEQQRRIYEQNSMENGTYETYYKTKSGGLPATPSLPSNLSQVFKPSVTTSPICPVLYDASYWDAVRQRSKMGPIVGKPPLMQTQKGQNQPVLIVRPQQALRDRHVEMKSLQQPRDSAPCDTQRSKSASPHFQRGDLERASFHVTARRRPVVADGTTGGGIASPRKTTIGTHEEDSPDSEGRSRPHPIFKRGSLLGNELVEYGSTGPKRVSFSNQSNVGADLAVGNWPTKHGTASEPPTRRHRSEDNTSDNDSVFLSQDRRDANEDVPCNVRSAGSRYRTDGTCSEQEYDANKPLPPPPKDLIISRRGNNARHYGIYGDARWSNEEQRNCQRGQGKSAFIYDSMGRR